MKNLLFSFILLVFSINLVESQNWQPVNKFDKYNYQIDTTDYITNTIWADSVEIIEEDSVFYLNRIMTNCDTCSNNEDEYYALKNQPQFLMRKMIKVSDSLYMFQDTIEFIIKPLLHFGEQWVFDPEQNIQAIISSEGEENIFGSLDSIKNISLSNGQSFKISKNYGILQFPFNTDSSYNLVGIEGGREFGEKVPNFWDFFDYDVGDIIQRGYNYGTSMGEWYESWIIKKYHIIDKQIAEDTIIYQIHGWKLNINYSSYPYPGQIDTTAYRLNGNLIFIDSMNHFTNKYNHEIIQLNYLKPILYEIYEPIFGQISICKSDNIVIKETGSQSEIFPYYTISETHNDLMIRNYDEFSGPSELFFQYTENISLKKYNLFWFEQWESETFHGYIHNGDTTGFVYPDEFFEQYSGISDVSNNDINIYPNPANDIVFTAFWTSSTPYGAQYSMSLESESDDLSFIYNDYNMLNDAYSVRCVKDSDK